MESLKLVTGKVDEKYEESHSISKQLFERASKLFPDGVTHDSRRHSPFPPYIKWAKGPKKWDVDGNEYIDYWMGHGALLFGHCYPRIVQAIVEQAQRGTHYGACHELEIRWAELITRLVPSAEKVRFHSSGTEANMMALRVSRAFTGRNKVVQLASHFHGWLDQLIPGATGPPYGEAGSSGIPKGVVDKIILLPPNNAEAIEDTVRAENDVAAVIVSLSETVNKKFLESLRSITEKEGVVLIFDEVISGFRLSSGGAQEFYDVKPDVTSLAKILAGGLPGGAVTGKKEIIDMISTKDENWNKYRKIPHQGTFNANPLSSSAGVACLSEIYEKRERIYSQLGRNGEYLRKGFNDIIKDARVSARAYGVGSIVKLNIYRAPLPSEKDYIHDAGPISMEDLDLISKISSSRGVGKLRTILLNKGIDSTVRWSFVSLSHMTEDLDKTLEAFRDSLTVLNEEGLIGRT